MSLSRCIQSLHCRKLVHVYCRTFNDVLISFRCLHSYIVDILNYSCIALLQCELSALPKLRNFFGRNRLPKIIDQYSAENEICRNTLNCCFRRQNRKRNSVGLYMHLISDTSSATWQSQPCICGGLFRLTLFGKVDNIIKCETVIVSQSGILFRTSRVVRCSVQHAHRRAKSCSK